MTDQNTYINVYLENISAMVHDQLNQIIQLKTQVKISEGLLPQKEAIISDLTSRLEKVQFNETEMNELKERTRVAEDSYHAILNKVSHMETLMNQYNDLKKSFVEKENQLNEAKNLIEELSIIKREKENLETRLSELKNTLSETQKDLESSKNQIYVLKNPKVDTIPITATKNKINTQKKKESVSLESPADVSIKESNDF